METVKKDSARGFTLIELLVVIAIIALLSTVAMTNYNSARARGRDAKRLSEITSLQKALNLYYDSCGGYPALGTPDNYVGIGVTGGLETTTAIGCSSGESLGSYMNTLPAVVSPNGNPYMYCSTADGADVGAASCDDTESVSYQITFNIENAAGDLSAGNYVATPTGFQPVP
jgi:prepilin-type N-terminal cleavage/methylation domain-containing protein